jgi:hypothetical protein
MKFHVLHQKTAIFYFKMAASAKDSIPMNLKETEYSTQLPLLLNTINYFLRNY